jgi:hypothetical protein
VPRVDDFTGSRSEANASPAAAAITTISEALCRLNLASCVPLNGTALALKSKLCNCNKIKDIGQFTEY